MRHPSLRRREKKKGGNLNQASTHNGFHIADSSMQSLAEFDQLKPTRIITNLSSYSDDHDRQETIYIDYSPANHRLKLTLTNSRLELNSIRVEWPLKASQLLNDFFLRNESGESFAAAA